MIGNYFRYKGQDLNQISADYEIWSEAERRKINSSDESSKIDGRHGVRLSPTFQRGRKIEIKGVILTNTRVGASKAMDWLDNLFALQDQWGMTEFFPFVVVDEQNREREILAKIKTPIEYETDEYDHIDGDGRSWRVTLEAEDARLFNKEVKEQKGAESVYWGFKLGVKLGKKMNTVSSGIVCQGEGNMQAPIRMHIAIKSQILTPLKIAREGKFFALDLDANKGDEIIIDSKERTVTKNGVNILAKRLAWSLRPTVKGETAFAITSKGGGLASKAFEVKVYFANVML